MSDFLQGLIKKEGWEVTGTESSRRVWCEGVEYPYTHPAMIWLKKYRLGATAEDKFRAFRKAHDYLWPNMLWHQWKEDRVRAHCEGWNYIGWAAGASAGKSFDGADIGLTWWLANPKGRGLVIASTTLDSLQARVWGYLTKLLSTMAVKMPFQYLGGNSPKVLYPANRSEKEIRDTIHGIFAVAAKQGGDDDAISSWIGRHPDDALMLILDEAPDLNPAIVKAFPNLDSSEKPFQVVAIGNSNSRDDLHGAICTPKNGWDSVDPLIHKQWETTQKNGICQFFSCYESPAIHEPDAGKRKLLSKFLITKEQIKEKEKHLGKDSDSFYRFVLGFWKTRSTEGRLFTKELLDRCRVYDRAEWLGVDPLVTVGGLDAAFSTGGDKCILRLAQLGQTINGDIVLDFYDKELLFEIKISAIAGKDAEIQIAEQVCRILDRFGCPLHNIAVDASGQGRALGGCLMLQRKVLRGPIKIYNTRTGSGVDKSFDIVPKTRHELWFEFRNFMSYGQIRGLDSLAAMQMVNRQVVQNPKTLRQELELKSDYRRRMAAVAPSLAHSPDEADAATLCLQAAQIAFGFTVGQKRPIPEMAANEIQKLAIFNQIRVRHQEEMKSRVGLVPVAGFSTGLDSLCGVRRRLP